MTKDLAFNLGILVPRTAFEMAQVDPGENSTAAYASFFGYDWGPMGTILGFPPNGDVQLAELLETAYGSLSGKLAVVVPPVPVTPQRALAIAIALGCVPREIDRQVEEIACADEASAELRRWSSYFEPWSGDALSRDPSAWSAAISIWTLIFPKPPEKPAVVDEVPKVIAIHVCPSGFIGVTEAVTPDVFSTLGERLPFVALSDAKGNVSAWISPQLKGARSEEHANCLRRGLEAHGFTRDGEIFTHPPIESLDDVRDMLQKMEDLSHHPEEFAVESSR